MIHWLVVNGLLRDMIGFIVGIVGAWLLGLARKLGRLLEDQHAIRDALDTSTPGGLSDVIDAYQKAQLDPGAPGGRR